MTSAQEHHFHRWATRAFAQSSYAMADVQQAWSDGYDASRSRTAPSWLPRADDDSSATAGEG